MEARFCHPAGREAGRWIFCSAPRLAPRRMLARPVRPGATPPKEARAMWPHLSRRVGHEELPYGTEYVPGHGVVARLTDQPRCQLAGEYRAAHRLLGPWYRRSCVLCGTRAGCHFSRWANGVLTEKA